MLQVLFFSSCFNSCASVPISQIVCFTFYSSVPMVQFICFNSYASVPMPHFVCFTSYSSGPKVQFICFSSYSSVHIFQFLRLSLHFWQFSVQSNITSSLFIQAVFKECCQFLVFLFYRMLPVLSVPIQQNHDFRAYHRQITWGRRT
jgi:hypothetical protein